MWPEASRHVHFCCSHQVAHFLSSSVISVISCSLSMSPCVSAVVSVHRNIIKWWHKLVFPVLLFSRLGLKPCFTLQGSNSRNVSAGRVLGHFGSSICGHTVEMLELGAGFCFSCCKHPCSPTNVVEGKAQETGQEERQHRRIAAPRSCRFLTMLSLPWLEGGQQVLDDGGADAIHFPHLFARHESNRAPLETLRIVPATPQENIHHLVRNTSGLFQELKEAIQLLTHVI